MSVTVASMDIIGTDGPDGMLIGNSTTSKIGMYGITPVAQQSVGAAVATTDLTTTGILAVINGYNTVIASLKLVGIVKT